MSAFGCLTGLRNEKIGCISIGGISKKFGNRCSQVLPARISSVGCESGLSFHLPQQNSLFALRQRNVEKYFGGKAGSFYTVSCSSSLPHTDTFANAKTEEDIIEGIKKEVAAKRLPSRAGPGMELFFRSYSNAVISSGYPGAAELAVKVMATVFDRIMVQFEDPFTFPSYHKRITAPYDYYTFGQNYVRPLIDFKNSFLGNIALFDQIQAQLDRGENVILLANHQTEADPAVLALLLETSHPNLATGLTYMAGDRVVLDPFCKPFSMGRNLLCIFSKKRMADDPSTADEKRSANMRTLREMGQLLRQGGNLIWIAPSGGRDRPATGTDNWFPAAFDPSAVELMRRMSADSGVPGHLYPMALLCYDIMPPPKAVEKELGEQRIIGFHGVATSVAPELHFEDTAEGLGKKEAREAFCSAVYSSVVEQYRVLEDAVKGGRGAGAASPPVVTLDQPWAAEAVLVRQGESETVAVAGV